MAEAWRIDCLHQKLDGGSFNVSKRGTSIHGSPCPGYNRGIQRVYPRGTANGRPFWVTPFSRA
jgi:hypothetical protein